MADGIYTIVERNRTCTFPCSIDCQVGAYQLRKGEKVKVISDGDGLFSVYVERGEGAISRLPAWRVNILVGYEMISRQRQPVGDMQ